ncbi:haloacid dehalogenase type II [Paracoccus liaowanqingii]|uniref:(S)-2-haloacid dehalogenase n=1 Tax=Paracoccus liaowanqingii TaxID=2560053 RepID=A0A4Z1CFV8_9RHOB|nr:haloacid dehalogenase type II [Paracoccus liaowanqingii]TGN39094.1 haloacid dehalogenase type II [Paracoccus liaowanqingii]
MTRPILVFDVNETLLDLDHLSPLFADLFGDGAVMRDWFAQLILYSQTVTLSGLHSDFATLAGGVLRMIGTIRGVRITEDDIARLRAALGSMPAHPDAADALGLLRDHGFRMVTLTNSPPSDGPSALQRSGLGPYFEQAFSVQPSGGFKPAPQTYRLVSEALNVPPSQLCLVACHVWDTIGLQALGGKGALVTHGVNALLVVPGLPQPDLTAADLTALARLIVQSWGT